MNIDLKRNTVTGQPIHSRLGPSSSHRWMNCAGSPALLVALGLHEEDSSEPAARGTVCHDITAECLMTGREAWEYAGKVYKEGAFTFTIDEEMTPEIEQNIKFVRDLMAKYEPQGAIMYVETQVRSKYDPEAYGTADVRIEVPGLLLIIVDFKYGRVEVEPFDEQMKQYGYYAYEMRGERMRGVGEPKNIELIIAQPYLPNPADHFRTHTMTGQELSDFFFNDVLFAMEETRDPNALLTMGQHCVWCPALRTGKCPAWAAVTEQLPIDLAPGNLTNDQIGQFRRQRKLIVKFLDGVEGEALVRLRMGQKVPGAKLVNKTGHRVWNESAMIEEADGKIVKKMVKDLLVAEYGNKALTTPKLKSPAQIEELTGGRSFSSRFAFKPDTGVTVADEDDKREPVVGLMERLDAQQAAVPV